jgi:hypothetical protein
VSPSSLAAATVASSSSSSPYLVTPNQSYASYVDASILVEEKEAWESLFSEARAFEWKNVEAHYSSNASNLFDDDVD